MSASIKQYEHRIEQVAALKTHIINYAKTHDTYVAYRRPGKRRRFVLPMKRIVVTCAAKRAFNDLGTKKLPTALAGGIC
ncbi:MAG: hypothetical protein ACLUKO_20365 [Enterocloster bolteae]